MKPSQESKASLSHSVVKSSLWLISFQVGDNVLGLVRLIILARLLTPAAFGLVGIAWLVLQILSAFTQTGIQQALIQSKHIEDKLNAAWTYLVLRGVILYAAVFATSPYLSHFFNAPQATPIIRIIALSLVFEGFSNIGMILFQKHFRFDKIFTHQIIANTLDAIVAIIAAFVFHNVWAIVYGSITNNIVRFILSYILSSYRPAFDFNFKKIKDLTSYGKWIFGSNALQFIYSQGDDILVGKILGPIALGYYQLAYKISNLPATQITHVISTVLFPAYAKIQDDKNTLTQVYITSLQLTSFLSFFLSTLIIYFAHDFILLFLGKQWLPIELPLQLLTIWGVLRSLGATTGPLWQAIGKPKTVTKLQFLQTVIFALSIYPLTIKYGITGASISIVVAALVSNFIVFFKLVHLLKTGYSRVLHTLLYPMGISLIIAGCYFVFKKYLFTKIHFVNFGIEAILVSVIYLGVSFLLSKYMMYSLYKNALILMDQTPLPKSFIQKTKAIVTYLT